MVEGCLFCGIASGDVPSQLVATSDESVAFRDIAPVAPTHVLVIPREHYATLAEVAAVAPHVLTDMARLAAEVADVEGIADGGYRMVANTGPDAQQSVFHAHFHVVGGRPMGWPPG